MFCSKCGKEVSEGIKFCGSCGEGIAVPEASATAASASSMSNTNQNSTTAAANKVAERSASDTVSSPSVWSYLEPVAGGLAVIFIVFVWITEGRLSGSALIMLFLGSAALFRYFIK